MHRTRALAPATLAIHAGTPGPQPAGAVVQPIYQSSTFLYAGQQSYHDVPYIRLNNTPNQSALARTLAALEGGEAALVSASGMAAISTTLLTVLAAGDHLLAQRRLYGGTHSLLVHDLPRLGITVDFIDPDRPETWAAALRSNTRALYSETLTNPLLRLADLPAMAAFARAHGLVSMIDNTVATPVHFRPIEHGFDLVLHSATKYLNGHSDIVAGAVVGSAALVEQVRQRQNHLGGALDPHACFLLQRGLKTLTLRMRQHSASAIAIAEFLARHPAVARVNYPGLAQHPDHARARALLPTGCSGLVSFELAGGRPAAEALLARVTLPAVAASLGGAESLITIPATTSHAALSVSEREAAGIAEGLVRLSVGLEDTQDLLDDLALALA
ncbi:MAG TPA: PLP-dependent transferase [Nannocystis sp.]|jgi:cystathionine beta-lyase/cystathionine gamma-synthase